MQCAQTDFTIMNEGEATDGEGFWQRGEGVAGFGAGLENEGAFAALFAVDGALACEEGGGIEQLGLLSAPADISRGGGDDEGQKQRTEHEQLASAWRFVKCIHGSTSRSTMSPACKESIGTVVIFFSQVAAP